jgi:hypothetical protein
VPLGARIYTSTGILSRAEQGLRGRPDRQRHVEHDVRFGDPMKVGAGGQNRLGLICNEG